MKTVGIIRERGQLTIPDPIRKVASWTANMSVVSISLEKSDQILITPHFTSKETEWERIMELVRKAREIKGKGRESGFEFIERNREDK
jgi:bifunctional DNA-binding transcriptional regulator/antitoxin component of YhaV-PrlF toxin-antitoxin module